LAHHVGESRHVIDRGIELGHRLECRHVIDLLVDFAEFRARLAPAGHGDHRRMGKERVAQPGREIERADHLRHADAGFSAGACVAVRHVGGGLLAMHMQALDVGAALDLDHGAAQHRRHMENMGDAVAAEHVGQAFGAEHFAVVAEGHGGRDRIGRKLRASD
jgi:hypothetical protein